MFTKHWTVDCTSTWFTGVPFIMYLGMAALLHKNPVSAIYWGFPWQVPYLWTQQKGHPEYVCVCVCVCVIYIIVTNLLKLIYARIYVSDICFLFQVHSIFHLFPLCTQFFTTSLFWGWKLHVEIMFAMELRVAWFWEMLAPTKNFFLISCPLSENLKIKIWR